MASDPPRGFLCPITLEVMADPVLCAKSGYTYERAAIEAAISGNPIDPMTRARISLADLVPNRALKDQIDAWREARGGEGARGGAGSSGSSAIATSTEAAARPETSPLELSAAVFPASPLLSDFPLLAITLSAPEEPPARAARRILAIVIDTSGSMGDAAKPAAPGAEEDGLSRLDLAKHSALTLIEALGDDVRGWDFEEGACERPQRTCDAPLTSGPSCPRELLFARLAAAARGAHDGRGQGACARPAPRPRRRVSVWLKKRGRARGTR